MDIIIVEACKKKNVKIMNLLIEALLNHPEYDLENIDFEEILIQVINEEEKIDVMQFLIETLLKLKTFNCKYINFENILTEVCRRDNTSVIKLIIETLISEKLFDVEYIDVENILLESIKESNVETVKLLIETILYEKIIDFSSFNIENILLEVCRRSNSEIMKLIIDILLNNESINLKNIDFENILIEACKEYNSDILQLLFDLIFNHKNIDSNCINLENVLIKSSQISHVDIFLILIEKLSFYSFNIKNLPLEKILPVANHKNYKKDNLKLFLEKLLNISLESSDGMDVTLIKNWKDTYLNVLINLIIEMNNLHLLKHILENSDVNNININIKDIYNKYPIVVAYEAIDYYKSEYISSKNNSLIHYYNSVEIFHFLLDYGANCDINNLNGISLLSQALNKKYYNVVKYLLKYKSFIGKKKINEANNSPKIKNAYKNIMNSVKLLSITEEDKKESEEIEYNFTLLVSSYLLNYKEAFKLLLKNSNVNEIDQCGLTLLHYSILKEDIEMVKFLIDNCADISIDNYSALLISICIENKDIFNLLVDNINFILDEKNTLKDQILMSLLKCFSFSIDEKINMLKTLSKKGYRFNNINPYKNSPLVYAIQIDSISLVQFLIKNDININDIDENGKSPLIYAIQKKSIELVTLLIENGANVNVMINNERNTSMSNLTLTLNSSNSLSSSNSNTDTDSENENSDNSHNSESHDSMISSNNSNNNLPVKYKNSQYSPLMYAIQEESIPLVELLINHGADVNYVSHNGISPLICAIQKNSYPMVELLLSKGAHVNITDGLWEFSTLVYAIEENSLPIAKLLIENGANVNYGGGKLLRSAIEKKSLPMLQLLIENGTRINEIAILMYAVCRGELEIFKYLSKYTRNINFNDRYDSNSVIKSVDKSGRTEIFEYLVKNNVNEFTDKIIKNIIFNDKLELLKILIENNYNVNSKDDEGNTLLVYAIKNCNKPMVEYLIDHGANISNINNEGKSIIDISLQYSYDYWGEKNYKLIKNLINNNL